MECPLVGSSVAEEGYRNAVAALQLGGEGRAGGDGHSCAHDAVGAQHTHAEVGDVH